MIQWITSTIKQKWKIRLLYVLFLEFTVTKLILNRKIKLIIITWSNNEFFPDSRKMILKKIEAVFLKVVLLDKIIS